MINTKFFSGMPAIALAFVFGLVPAGCATGGGDAEPSQEEQAERLASNINTIEAGKATVNGDTVTLTGGVRLENAALTVPSGVTLDLTKETLRLGNNAALTVDGAVDAKAEGINVDGAAASPATINGSGTINLKSKGSLLGIWEGRKLTLDGVTLVGLPDNDRPLVEIGSGGEFVLSRGAITGNVVNREWASGGGVYVGGKSVTVFTMKGGAISGNSAISNGDNNGGGVCVNAEVATFIMEGGTIYGKAAEGGKANNAAENEALSIWGSVKWGSGGTYTKGGVPQTGGSDIGSTNDTLIAIPAK
jgi:hypothetical protein